MTIIRIKRSGSGGSPGALAQGEMGYSFLGGTQSNGGDRLYIGTGTETGGIAANIAVIGGKYFTDKLSHVPGILTNNAAVIVDGSGRVNSFTANTLTLLAVSANGSVGTAGQLLTSNGSTVYWSAITGTTNIGQTSNSSTISITSSTGSGTTLAAANSTTAGLLSADAQTIAGVKTFSSAISGSITGNAGTATTLQTARNINGVSFNGSADVTITAVNPNALTIGTGLSGTSYNGSSAVTIAIDSTVATLTGLQTLTNKTLTDPVITGNTSVSGNMIVSGNLTINGTTTTLNSTTLTVDDINIELGSVASPTDITAEGGGITLKGATDKTIAWSAANGWTSSENFNLVTSKTYKINGVDVLSSTSLGSGVVGSSLTSVGTIGTGVWQGTLIGGTYGGTGVNNGAKTITIGGNISTANSVTTSGNFALSLTTSAATSVTLPTSGTLVGSEDTGTVTSTMILDGTIVNTDINAAAAIAITKLAASTISGVSLGNNLNTLTFGTGLTAGGASYNGSTASTITAVTANNTALGVASFDINNFTVATGAVSISSIDGGTY